MGAVLFTPLISWGERTVAGGRNSEKGPSDSQAKFPLAPTLRVEIGGCLPRAAVCRACLQTPLVFFTCVSLTALSGSVATMSTAISSNLRIMDCHSPSIDGILMVFYSSC